MNAHVLLKLLNELRKRYKMGGLLSILSLFCNKFRNSIIQEHDVRFYLSYDIKIILDHFFGLKMLGFFHMCDVKSVIS